jgi:broad specificity phosphatase PhoE
MLVSHYFVILTVICAALGMPLAGLRRFRIQVASISILDFKNGKPCLSLLGDTCHLSGG